MKSLLSKGINACLLSAIALTLISAKQETPLENLSELRVVPVLRTPEADNVKTDIYFPSSGELIEEMPMNVQVKVSGYPVGIVSEFKRAKELRTIEKGQCLRVVIDEDQYFDFSKEVIQDTLKDQLLYFDQTLDIDLNLDLTPGEHVLRAYLVRSFGESLKSEEAQDARTFFYKEKTPNPGINIKDPYITYNEPRGTFHTTPDKPILLDFLISNCRLSQDGYKIKLTIDGKENRILTHLIPYYIYGLGKGSHTIKLELLDGQNKPVKGLFCEVSQQIMIE